jgi:hypothetical protein
MRPATSECSDCALEGAPHAVEAIYSRREVAAYSAAFGVSAGLVLAGLWSIASHALAVQALGQRIILSMVL